MARYKGMYTAQYIVPAVSMIVYAKSAVSLIIYAKSLRESFM